MRIEVGSKVRLKTKSELMGMGIYPISEEKHLFINEFCTLPKEEVGYLGLEGEVTNINCSDKLDLLLTNGTKLYDIAREIVTIELDE